MGLSLVRAALKKSALGEILEPATQEQLISAIENQVQHALAPEGALSTSIRVQMTNVLQQSNKTVREIFAGTEAGTSAAANDPSGPAQHADGRPPPMGGMSPVETRATNAASVTHDGSYGISTEAVLRGVHNRRQQAGTIPYRGGHLGYAVLSYTWHYTYDQTTTFNTQFVITHSLQTHYIKANTYT